MYYRGSIYLVKYAGLVTCYDAGNGEKHFREKLGVRGYYCASSVASDGKIYLRTAKHMMAIRRVIGRSASFEQRLACKTEASI